MRVKWYFLAYCARFSLEATLLFCQCWHAIIYHGVTAMTHFRAFEHGSSREFPIYVVAAFYFFSDLKKQGEKKKF